VGRGATDRAGRAERQRNRIADRHSVNGVITAERKVGTKLQRSDLMALRDRAGAGGQDQHDQEQQTGDRARQIPR
jgi:hypothetical protein